MIGQHERGYPRNVLTRRLLERTGCSVSEKTSFAPGALREAELLAHLARHGREFDLLFVTEGGHRYVPVLAPLARALRIPIVFDAFTSRYNTYVEDRQTVAPGSLRAHQLHWLDKLAIHGADACVFDTHEHARYFADRYGAPERSCVIEIGVDEALFRPLSPAAAERFEVLFYGTYIPLQGVERIVEAAAQLAADRSIGFTLVGSGQTHAEVAARARALALPNLELRAAVPPHELPVLIARAHVLLGIFGGTTKAENVVPNKVVQAAACARPIITRRSPAIERYFEDGVSALLVPPDPAALAAAVVRLRDDRELRATLARNARAVFERHFSEPALTAKMAAALAALR
jgi:glycosyltransferase involved in cell wall biosynthesis